MAYIFNFWGNLRRFAPTTLGYFVAQEEGFKDTNGSPLLPFIRFQNANTFILVAIIPQRHGTR